MLTSLRKFKEHLDIMEGEFEQANLNNNTMNKMLSQYEQTLQGQFGNQMVIPDADGQDPS